MVNGIRHLENKCQSMSHFSWNIIILESFRHIDVSSSARNCNLLYLRETATYDHDLHACPIEKSKIITDLQKIFKSVAYTAPLPPCKSVWVAPACQRNRPFHEIPLTSSTAKKTLGSKKSPTGPTERTPKPEYLIALATSLGVRW